MAGYTRQDTTGQLANGNPIDADIFNDEYDAIEGAFNASTGHTHDGTAGGGAPIESIGPSQELEVTSNAVFPKVDNLIDSGKSTLQWRNGYFGTDVLVGQDVNVTRDVSIGRNLTVTGDATINGNLILGDAATDTINFNADAVSDIKPDTSGTYNLGSSTQEWNNLWLDGTANVDNLTVDENGTVAGTFDVTGAVGIDGDFDINTTMFTIAAATGNTTIAGTLDVTGATTLTGAVTATGGVTGDVTGDVTGNVTGDVTGNLTGDVTGDVTGDLTGNVVGDVNGNLTGNVTGDVTGNVVGNVTGDITGDVTGDLTGDIYASDGVSKILENGTVGTDATFTGSVTGDVVGNLTGDVTGNVTGNVTGDVTGDLTGNVTGNVTGDLTGNVTGDVTGDVTGNVTGNINGTVGGVTPAAGTFTTMQFSTHISDGTRIITGFVDEDDMVSNSSSLIPTQQSVKSYVDDTLSSGSGDISASSVSVATGTGGLDLDGGSGTGWVIYQSGTELKFKYNGVDKFKLSSAGALEVEDDVTAYGNA